ncbi:cytochrome c [bacterium]|nr:cytochrome c [bacterium]
MADSKTSQDLRPDLNETINVSKTHAAIKESAPAAKRENHIRENGMESVSLWLIVFCAFVVLVGGAVMGQGGAFLGYGELTKKGYQQGKSPVDIEAELLPEAALVLLQKEGKKIYTICSSCHQSSGAGQGDYPPLVGSEWVLGNTEMLAMIIHNGLKGPIQVNGQAYGGQNMNAVGASFGPKELAAVMTFIRTSWGNEAELVTPEMAEAALEISKKRGGGQVTAEELKKNHDKMLPGDKLDPEALLDPETWEPVDAAN